ncbi:hypothetical protein R6Q59_017230 [Mikania micrantha]
MVGYWAGIIVVPVFYLLKRGVGRKLRQGQHLGWCNYGVAPLADSYCHLSRKRWIKESIAHNHEAGAGVLEWRYTPAIRVPPAHLCTCWCKEVDQLAVNIADVGGSLGHFGRVLLPYWPANGTGGLYCFKEGPWTGGFTPWKDPERLVSIIAYMGCSLLLWPNNRGRAAGLSKKYGTWVTNSLFGTESLLLLWVFMWVLLSLGIEG